MANPGDPYYISPEEFKMLWGYYNLDFNDMDKFPEAKAAMISQIMGNPLFKPELNGPRPCENCGARTLRSQSCRPQKCPTLEQGLECSSKCHNNTCKNRRLTKGDYVDIMTIGASNVDKKGFGLFNREPAVPGQLIGEFVGELKMGEQVPEKFCVTVGSPITHRNGSQSYLYLDATERGNVARNVQSSCNPNCRYVSLICGKSYRVGLIATKFIKKKAELYVENPRLRPDQLICTCSRRYCVVRDAQPPESPTAGCSSRTSSAPQSRKGREPRSKKLCCLDGLPPVEKVDDLQPGLCTVDYPIPPQAFKKDDEDDSDSKWYDYDEKD